MVPIYLCSAIALGIFCRKVLEFRAKKLNEIKWLDCVVEAVGDCKMDRARRRAEEASHPVGRVVVAMLDTHDSRPDRVSAEAKRVGSQEIQELEKQVSVLSFVAQAAPLLGLLGTVLGMVELFMSLQGTGTANVDAALLASGIWKALLTTAAGLMVAVPTLAAYSYLHSRTDLFRLVLADSIERVLTAIPLPDEGDGGERQSRPHLVRETADAI